MLVSTLREPQGSKPQPPQRELLVHAGFDPSTGSGTGDSTTGFRYDLAVYSSRTLRVLTEFSNENSPWFRPFDGLRDRKYNHRKGACFDDGPTPDAEGRGARAERKRGTDREGSLEQLVCE